jgi:hypothetical protein
MALHPQTFGDFRNRFIDREVVLVGAGHTLNNYNPLPNAIHIALNRAFLYNKIGFDFIFSCDLKSIEKFLPQFNQYEGTGNCIKFIGRTEFEECIIPQFLIDKMDSVRKYYSLSDGSISNYIDYKIPVDIERNPLWACSTVAHHAFQFALWGNPKAIYLVGCDCTGHMKGHFVGDEKKIDNPTTNNDDSVVDGWYKLKHFASVYYPNIKIVSINPIRLKGLFEDIYQ